MSGQAEWWREGVVYQVYLRSFADASGDGIGDIAGIRAKLDYLAGLGVDALWINPWYPSPQADGGYDVSDYCNIDPAYGDLQQADALIREAHDRGLRIILDIVPNHTSSEHPWFRDALAGDSEARGRYLFRPGRGEDGELPPNDWESAFGGSAWSRVDDGSWYLHLFAPAQPDLDWTNPAVRSEFRDVLRFWFDRGVDGFRIDVAHGLVKAEGLPDAGPRESPVPRFDPHPAWDQDGVHEVYREWREVAEEYADPKVFVAEAWASTSERLAHYIRPDELHTAFHFDFLHAPVNADYMRKVIEDSLAQTSKVDAMPTWVLSNHDCARHRTRYARSQPDHIVESSWERERWGTELPDLELGGHRARAVVAMLMALPGSLYLYQGDELGLVEVEDLPDEVRQDPLFVQSGGRDPGRDGCRVPIPWTSGGSSYGFSPAGSTAHPWLPQPHDWGQYAADQQVGDPESFLEFHRLALRLRREHLVGSGGIEWQRSGRGALCFRRGEVECWFNAGDDDVTLPTGELLLHTRGGDAAALPPGSTAWLVPTRNDRR